MRRVVLWRHGRTVWNAENRFQGHSDIPLDDTGRAQAVRAAALLAALDPAMIVSSDLVRASETAGTLAALCGLDVRLDKRLRERGGGEWEGLTRTEIKERWPEEFKSWEAPGGEHLAEVAERVAASVSDWVAETPESGVLVVVSHGAAIRMGVATLLGLPERLWPALGGVANCSWSVLGEGSRAGGAPGEVRGWRLLEHNAGTLPEPVHSDDR